MNRAKPEQTTWVTVASFYSDADAHIAMGLLESNGIPCFLVNDTLASVYPMTATWTPIELKVPESLLDEARTILPNPPEI